MSHDNEIDDDMNFLFGEDEGEEREEKVSEKEKDIFSFDELDSIEEEEEINKAVVVTPPPVREKLPKDVQDVLVPIKNKTEIRETAYQISTNAPIQIDFGKMHEKAIQIFTEQAGLDDDDNTKPSTLSDLETRKAKANNFLEAISGIVEIGHQVELLQAESDKFKRSDELKLLNGLRITLETQSSLLQQVAETTAQRLEIMMRNIDDTDPEDLAMLQTVLQSNIDATSKVIAGASRVIQLERFSGGRSWGKPAGGAGIGKVIVGALPPGEVGKQKEGEGTPKGQRRDQPPRALTPEEIKKIQDEAAGKKSKDEF